MPTIELDDVKGAIHKAWVMWGMSDYKGFSYQLESGQSVNIIFDRKDKILNYGFPNMYIMDRSNIPALKTWWEDDESKIHNVKGDTVEGELRPREQKSPGVYGVNAYYASYVTFNFHVPTT